MTKTEALDIPDLRLPEFVLGQARSRGAKPALIDAVSGREISYERLAGAVSAATGRLAGAGVRPGDVVALCAPNSAEFVIAWYAALSAGAAVTTVNPAAAEAEIVSQCQRAGARWLITPAGLLLSKLAAVARRVPGIAGTFVLSPCVPSNVWVRSARSFDVLSLGVGSTAGDGGTSGEEPAGPGVSPGDVACLPTSSGTTGRPKIVVLTHRQLVANAHQITQVQRVTDRDVTVAVVPLFHVYGLQATLNSGLARGATIVILPRFEPREFLRVIQDYRVTRVEVAPPVAVLLAKSELVDEFDLSSLRLITSAAAPLSADAARACSRRLGVRVGQAFGMTEIAGGTHFAPEDGADRPDSVGLPLPGVECRVVDPGTGRDLGPGEPGELLVRTPSLMTGYLGDPAATAAAVDGDGWLHTGDIVTVDGDGWYRVTDRIKELIKYKGHQVAPAELEDILLAHPAVADAAVVRSPDETAGEVPKAFIVPAPDAPLASADDLMAWVAERVAPYKRVRRVEFTGSIPKTPAGKILRRQLAEREYRAAPRQGG